MIRVDAERVAAAWLGHSAVPWDVQIFKYDSSYVKAFTECVEARAAVGHRAFPDIAVFLGEVVERQFFK